MADNFPLIQVVKILVIDDNRIIRHLLKATLSSVEGYQLFEADSADNALPVLTQEKPNLIILDIMMPGELNGLQLCRMIKSNQDTRHIKVILLSAKDEESVRELAKEAEADCYLTKPFSPAKLLTLVSSL